jgi:hypothetical protein
MTSHISKLFQFALSTLAIVPLSLALNLSPARAEAPDAIGDITELTGQIANNRNPLQPASDSESIADNSASEASSARDRSMEYVKKGYAAEEAGNAELAIQNYIAAVQMDETNGYGFLLLGRLVGNNKEGIMLVQKSAELFQAENDSEGLELATKLLKSANAAN